MNSIITSTAGYDVSARATVYAVISGSTVDLVGP